MPFDNDGLTSDASTRDHLPVPYVAAARRQETPDTVTLSLRPKDRPLPAFRPGQFAMLYAFGVGEIPVSVSGVTDGDGPLQHTVRAVGAVSTALCALRIGDMLGVRGPFGKGWEYEAGYGHDVLIVAGGIGIAPLRPLVHAAAHSPDRVAVLLGARAPGELLYHREYASWREHARVEVTVDRAGRGWPGDVGFVTTLLSRIPFRPEHTSAFVCGPEAMIRHTAGTLLGRGVPPDRIRVSLERNMRCATATCGHCQLGPLLLCRDGPVVGFDRADPLLCVREL